MTIVIVIQGKMLLEPINYERGLLISELFDAGLQ